MNILHDPDHHLGFTESNLEQSVRQLFKFSEKQYTVTPEDMFCWAFSFRDAAIWLSRFSNDTSIKTVLYNGFLWNIVHSKNISDAILKRRRKDYKRNRCVGLAVSAELLQIVTYLDLKEGRCFTVSEKDSSLHLGSVDIQGDICAYLTIILRQSFVTIHPIPFEISPSVSSIYGFSMDCNQTMKWSPMDSLGVFDIGCPFGTQGSFFEKYLHKALFAKKSADITNFPKQHHRLVYFSNDQCSYFDLSSVLYAYLDTYDSPLDVGDVVVMKIDFLMQDRCMCDDTDCTCKWIKGSDTRVTDGYEIILEQSASMDCSGYNIKCFAPRHALRIVLSNNRIPSHNSRILCQKEDKNEFFEGTVIHSGCFELRYIHFRPEFNDYVCVTASNIFQIHDCSLTLGTLVPGSINDHIVCTIESHRPNRIQTGFIGLYPANHPHILEPLGDLFHPISIALCSSGKVEFDPYYFPFTKGGAYECRFIEHGRITSISKRGILTPVIILRDTYEKTGFEVKTGKTFLAQKLVCLFEIFDSSVWSCWDRIELVSKTADEVYCWCYVTPECKNNQRVSTMLPDHLPLGTYAWQYSGKSITVHGNPFEVFLEDKDAKLRQKLGTSEYLKAQKEKEEREHQIFLGKQATTIQCAFRSKVAKQMVREKLNSTKEDKILVKAELKEAKSSLDVVLKANSKRSANLLSRKDKAMQARFQELVDELEGRFSKLVAGVSPQMLEEEKIKIALMQAALQQEQEQAAIKLEQEIEQQRLESIRYHRLVRKSPYNITRNCSQFQHVEDFSKNIQELSEWIDETGNRFTDDEFPQSTESILGTGNSLICNKLLQGCGSVSWMRLKQVFLKKNGAPPNRFFVEKVHFRKIGVFQRAMPECAYRAFEVFHLTLSAVAEHGTDWMSNLVNIEYQHNGVFSVQLFLHGKWTSILVDDTIPCICDDTGKWIPAFTSCDHDLVGMWLFIVEKAFAKIHGSYEAAFTAKYEFQELLAIFTGGLPFTFHNTVLKSIDSNPHFNVPNDDGFTLSPFPGINTTDSFIDIIRAIR